MTKMRSGFVMSQALTEKVNPGRFDQELTVLQYSESTNSIGEKVRTWTDNGKFRCLVKELQASEEKEMEQNIVLRKVVKVWAWYEERLNDNRNKILYKGNTYNIIEVQEVYGRKRFIMLKIMQFI